MMTVKELIDALAKYPPDMRVMGAAYDSLGDACVQLRTVLPSDDELEFGDENDGDTFLAVVIAGEDDTHCDAGPG